MQSAKILYELTVEELIATLSTESPERTHIDHLVTEVRSYFEMVMYVYRDNPA